MLPSLCGAVYSSQCVQAGGGRGCFWLSGFSFQLFSISGFAFLLDFFDSGFHSQPVGQLGLLLTGGEFGQPPEKARSGSCTPPPRAKQRGRELWKNLC
jgi:hypothetical protein